MPTVSRRPGLVAHARLSSGTSARKRPSKRTSRRSGAGRGAGASARPPAPRTAPRRAPAAAAPRAPAGAPAPCRQRGLGRQACKLLEQCDAPVKHLIYESIAGTWHAISWLAPGGVCGAALGHRLPGKHVPPDWLACMQAGTLARKKQGAHSAPPCHGNDAVHNQRRASGRLQQHAAALRQRQARGQPCSRILRPLARTVALHPTQ